MQFSSYIFIFIFLPVTLIGYWLLQRFKKAFLARCYLFICSLVFYTYVNVSFLPILLGSILVNYGLGWLMFRPNVNQKNKKLLCILGVALNIGMLVYCKYTSFFISTLNTAFAASFNMINVILPLGISFFTFQQVTYLLDRYRGEAPDYKPLDYALFVSFFPTITSGPIAMHHEMIPQFNDAKRHVFSNENFAKGIYIFSLGLAKKMLLAEFFALIVNWGFASDISKLGTVNAILVMFSYTLQIYFDFSGYSDMASGIARMLNMELPVNFNSPYKARDINDFWKRWHMTLTRLLTKYIYYPLGGNRKGKMRTYLNIMIVFLLSGLWHGAGLTFIVWGALHGIASVITRVFKKQIDRLHPAFGWLFTFVFVNIAWIFFRANSITQAGELIREMTSMRFLPIDSGLIDAANIFEFKLLTVLFGLKELPVLIFPILVVIGIVICLITQNLQEKLKRIEFNLPRALITAILLVWSILSMSNVTEFLYMSF